MTMRMTIEASIHARWGHRVDGLIHTHAWKVAAMVSGDTDCDKVFHADHLEAHLADAVEAWRGRYLTTEDVGEWKGYQPLVWNREPTVEEITRQIWAALERDVPGLHEVSLEEATESDRCRVVRFTRTS
jgi:6-pyruvoyl-tetrahydropterin synthase